MSNLHPLKAWRMAHKLSLRAAGARIGVAANSFSMMERGLSLPRHETAQRVLAETGVGRAALVAWMDAAAAETAGEEAA